MAKPEFQLLFLLLLLPWQVQTRLIISDPYHDLVSDGIIHDVHHNQPHLLHLNRPSSSSSSSCEQTYGFLPCTTTVLGNLFLMLVYGYLMFVAAKLLSTGGDILLQLVGPGIVGGLFLPILGSLPDALLILVSGLSGSRETAQHHVLIGMGLLAGSTIMLLTLLWGSCVVVGKCDLSEDSTSLDSQDTKRCSLTGSGVTTEPSTCHAARIMVISVIPLVIVQLPNVFKSSSGEHVAVLVSLVVSIALLLSYCLYEVFEPRIQERRLLKYAEQKLVVSGILKHVKRDALGRLLTQDGKPNIPVIEKRFQKLDLDCDGYISHSELTALLVGINFEDIDLDTNDAVERVMEDFDASGDVKISKEEFIEGLSKWLNVAISSVSQPKPFSSKFVDDFHKVTKEELNKLIAERDKTGESHVWCKAVTLLLLGTVLAAVFADPLVDAVNNFSSATSIPSFFISFIAMPLATNSSEAVSTIIFASRKEQKTTSVAFAEIYGSVTMNNTLCLSVFFALIYFRHLTWDFSAEVMIILIVCIVMGLFASFSTTFQLWTCFVAFLLYPFSVVLVYVLDYCFGWS
ncbi:EF-hand domain-containing protein [Cinnamomum micranthum f. kanehirae]|uniref:EF-hand domain-containing protein n=1 Tax=Cinnamomum micranthum f. kanehirae TaxID=337451 RepID=A0A443Q3B8_9MAGN|nr:EF-hand domain-containing protein [Cinnamomum micranthum f. kanehirae]